MTPDMTTNECRKSTGIELKAPVLQRILPDDLARLRIRDEQRRVIELIRYLQGPHDQRNPGALSTLGLLLTSFSDAHAKPRLQALRGPQRRALVPL